jgi:heme-degrading monooxygenase HmoA
MAIAAVFQLPPDGIDGYDRAAEGPLREQAGRLQHVCFKTDAGYTVVDVWESIEAFEAFGNAIEAFLEESGEPAPVALQVYTVHNILPAS